MEIQRQRVASFASLVSWETEPPNSRNKQHETRNLINEHETAKLTQAQERQALAQADIELQRAKLTTAREARAFAEQQHRIEHTRLAAQIAEVDLQLTQLTTIRAPFAGTIKRIEWEDMHNETITVLVYLSVGSQ